MGETLKHAITINERRGRDGGEKEWDRHPRHVIPLQLFSRVFVASQSSCWFVTAAGKAGLRCVLRGRCYTQQLISINWQQCGPPTTPLLAETTRGGAGRGQGQPPASLARRHSKQHVLSIRLIPGQPGRAAEFTDVAECLACWT